MKKPEEHDVHTEFKVLTMAVNGQKLQLGSAFEHKLCD
jgi:hypothetical protein